MLQCTDSVAGSAINIPCACRSEDNRFNDDCTTSKTKEGVERQWVGDATKGGRGLNFPELMKWHKQGPFFSSERQEQSGTEIDKVDVGVDFNKVKE